MRSRDSRGFRICISVYLNGLYLLCRLLLKHELGLTLKIFRFSNKNFPDHQRRTPPQLVLTRISNFLTRKLTKLKNLRILQFRFSYNFKSSDWFFSFSFSLSKKKGKFWPKLKWRNSTLTMEARHLTPSFSNRDLFVQFL